MNGNSISNNKSVNQSDNNRLNSTPIKNTVSFHTSKDYFEISQRQGKKLQSVIDTLTTFGDTMSYKIINRLCLFHIDYLKKNHISESDLFDYILKAANERIDTAKRNFVKKECEIVIQIVRLLKNGVKTEDIINSVFPTERVVNEKETIVIDSHAINNKLTPKTEKQIYVSPTHSIIISQVITGLLNNAISREDLKASQVEALKQEETKSTVRIVSQIINSLIENAIRREEEQAVEAESSSASIDTAAENFNRFELSDQNKYDDGICPADGVPYWEHTYIYSVADLQRANHLQKQFYHYFRAQFLKERYLDIKDNSNYAFILMFDIADDYKEHKDYDLLKHQLNTLAENYPVVARYINKAITQVVTTVKQEKSENVLRSYDKSRGQLCRWVTPNEAVEVQGVKLTRGNFYIGECFRLPDSIIRENSYYTFGYKRAYIYGSVLNPDLPASDTENFRNAFCSYNDMSPAWRYEYLMWLSGKKQASDVPVEILLFYLYGCELRMFIDPQTKKSERKTMLLNIIELCKSLDIESPENDERVLQQKLSDFIGCAIIKYFRDTKEEFNTKGILKDCSTYQNYYIACKIAGKKTLSPEDAFDIANEIYDIEQLVPSEYIPIAQKYFMDNFTRLCKSIDVNFEMTKTQNQSVCYYNNNGYFNSEKIILYHEIDSLPYDLWMVHDIIRNSYWNVESKFRRYNRVKKRSNGKETIAAVLLLPNEIDITEIPKIQTLITHIENKMQSDQYLVKPIDWLLELWEYERKEERSIHKEYADSIIGGLRRLGFDIVPDYEIDKKRFNFGDICVIYKNEEHLPVNPTTKYERSELFIKLASYIVHTDKATNNDFAFVEQQLKSYNNTAGNHLHLMASIRWRFQLKKQLIDKHAQNIIATLASEQRTYMGNALIRLACINGDILPKRIDSLKKVLPLLGIEASSIHSQIHRLLTDGDGFAVIEKKSNAVEFTINGKPVSVQQPTTPSVVINPKKLRIFEQQTKAAQELLSDIFVDEKAAKSQNAASGNTPNMCLDILKLLLTKEIWKRTEIEDICKERGLMLGAVLEQINDFAYEKVDDAVVDDDGKNIYVTLDYKEDLI